MYSRGKIKFIYDCELHLDIEGVGEYKDAKSTVTIKEISNADLDDDFEFEFDSVTKKENNNKYQIIQIFKANKKNVQNDIRKIFDLFKEAQLK